MKKSLNPNIKNEDVTNGCYLGTFISFERAIKELYPNEKVRGYQITQQGIEIILET